MRTEANQFEKRGYLGETIVRGRTIVQRILRLSDQVVVFERRGSRIYDLERELDEIANRDERYNPFEEIIFSGRSG